MGLRVFLHTCCGPCSIGPAGALRKERHDVTGFFFNPNIHPYREYRKRQEAMEDFSKQEGLPVVWRDSYDLEGFLRTALDNMEDRCRQCYRLRLKEAAFRAREGGFPAFTTTLLVSPYQEHEVIVEEAEKASKASGVDFLYRDFRPLYRDAARKSRDMGLYRQGYCGCVFSELERYGSKKG